MSNNHKPEKEYIRKRLLGGSFEDLSPELQEILSKRCPADTEPGLIEETRDTSEKRIKEPEQ